MVDVNYFEVATILRQLLLEKKQLSIQELYSLNELNAINYESFTALLKILIKYGIVIVVEKKTEKFTSWIVKANKSDTGLAFLESKKPTFNEIKICITLPRFNIFGLTDILKSQRIEIFHLLDEFISLFKNAKEIIRICSPFIEWSGFVYFKDLLLEKVRQGVKLRILGRQLLPHERDNRHKDIKQIYETFKSRGLENFVEIRNYFFLTETNILASSIHAKMIVGDNGEAYVGSGEIRENSFVKNLEIGTILSGEKVLELVKIFDGIYSKSEVVSFE